MACGGAEVSATLEEEKLLKKKAEALKEWEEFKKMTKKKVK